MQEATGRVVTLLARALALAATAFLAPAAATASTMEAATARLGQSIAAQADCAAGGTALVGIFPFDEARLPLAPANAFALYESFLGTLIDDAPDCVRFIDGRGAFVTLEYLGRGDLLRESGQQQRARIQQSLGRADFTLDGSVVETGAGLMAIFRLTDMASGQALSRTEFPVPTRFRGDGCGVGALPEGAALRAIAGALIARVPDLAQVLASGGRHGPSDSLTDAGRFLEDQLLAELTRAAENALTGRAIGVSRQEAPLPPRPGEHALHLHYWPCESEGEGHGAARLSVTLRSAEGRDVTEQRAINLAGLPAGLALHPPRPALPRGELLVTPALAGVGDEIALLAGPPSGCAPFFFNLAPSGRLTPIPLQFFRQLDLGAGLVRYEISPQWDFGLVVQEDDEPGLNRLGYLCQPARLEGEAALRGLLRDLRERVEEESQGLIEAEGAEPVYFQTQGFEIVR